MVTNNKSIDTSLEYWLSVEGSSLLTSAKEILANHDGDTLRAGTALRKYSTNIAPNLIAEAFEILTLREKARPFGAWVENGFFTRQSLEQATAPVVARHHAERFAKCHHVLEICTGAGFDTAALARVVGRVTTIEQDVRLAEMARQNLAAQSITNVQVLCGAAADVLQNFDITSFDGLWCDPSRRNAQGQRIENPDEYSPPLSWLQTVIKSGIAGIKISPAANVASHLVSKETNSHSAWAREWVGIVGECREQVLWRGAGLADGTAVLPDAGAEWIPPQRRIESRICETPLEHLQGHYLAEPHGCIIRSGRLADFFAEQNISLLDEHIAYGVCQTQPPQRPWLQVFRIIEAFPFHRKTLRKRILAHAWGNSIEIKKRGFPETPDEIRTWLKLPPSKNAGTLIITRVGKGHAVMLTERL
jgi:hypothetical protein